VASHPGSGPSSADLVNASSYAQEQHRTQDDFGHGQSLVRLTRGRHQAESDGNHGTGEPHCCESYGNRPAARNANHSWRRPLALQPEHGSKHERIGNEISHHSQTNQDVISASNAGSGLSQKDE
jgi:hypothetical protein